MSNKDFKSFLNSEKIPSNTIDKLIREQNKKLHREDQVHTILLSLGTHTLAGIITLLFCPQFGLNPFGASIHVPHYFMQFGAWACGLFCGGIFIGTGSVLKLIFLPKRYLSIYQNSIVKNSILLCAIFYGLFMLQTFRSNEEAYFLTLNFSLFWVFGGVLLDILTTKISVTARTRVEAQGLDQY